MKEIWKDIKGYEGIYEVSNLGNFRSITRKDKFGRKFSGRYRKTQIDKDGYLFITLWHNGKCKNCRAHRLVAEAFIPNIDNKPIVNHIDGNKKNNNVLNFEWCTNSENDLHAFKMGLRMANKTGTGKFGGLNGASKAIYMLDKDTEKIITRFDSLADAGRYLGRNPNKMSHIAKVCRGERNTAYGYKWRYANDEVHSK